LVLPSDRQKIPTSASLGFAQVSRPIRYDREIIGGLSIMAVKKEFSSFQDLLNSTPVPVLVDFYAIWCPCQMMAPILEQTGLYLKDRLQVVKIDTDKYPNLASQYQIQALPTLVLFKNGEAIDRIEGVIQADRLIQHLQTLF
jgi:thioredoxin